MKSGGNRTPDDFEYNGWSRANNYLLKEEDFENRIKYVQERFRRSGDVRRAWCKTKEGREQTSIAMKEQWAERSARARAGSDTTEILLLEKLTTREDGVTTSELVANCINMIAKELSRRGARDLAELSLKDLVLIANTLIGLTKSASAAKKENKFVPNTLVVNNINTSKTGGVVGDIESPKRVTHE